MLKADDYFNMYDHEVEDMNKDSALQILGGSGSTE